MWLERGGRDVVGRHPSSGKMFSPKKSAHKSPKKTPLRTALYHLDLLLAPPPVGLGYKELGRPVSGKYLVDWIVGRDHPLAATREEAIEILENMERAGGVECVRGVREQGQYVHCGAKKIRENGVLNQYLRRGLSSPCAVKNIGAEVLQSVKVVERFNEAWAGLCKDCLRRDGHEVRYELVRDSEWWPMALEMVQRAGEIEDVTNLREDIGESGWKAFCFNLYNIMVWHGKIILGSPTSIAGRGRFFDGTKYWMGGTGGLGVSLSELEHGLLRRKWANKQGIRRKLVLTEKDPRMHFILNCGAQSCPPITPLNTKHAEQQIADSTSLFISKNCMVDAISLMVKLSRLWKWFRPDFVPGKKNDLALLRWISEHGPEETRIDINSLLSATSEHDVKVEFSRYNWADNGDWNAKPDVRLMHVYDLSFKQNV